MMDYSVAIATLQQADSTLAALIERAGPCRLNEAQQTGDLFACLARAIIHQQLSGKSAAAIHQRFLQLSSEPRGPTAAEILATPEEQLRSVGLSRSKIVYVRDLAQRTVDGLPTLEELAGMDDEQIMQTLLPIKGVGRWTVQMLLIFRLHRWDVLPSNDLGIRAGIRKTYELPELPTVKQVEEMGQRWQPYRTIASWYLWRSLELT